MFKSNYCSMSRFNFIKYPVIIFLGIIVGSSIGAFGSGVINGLLQKVYVYPMENVKS